MASLKLGKLPDRTPAKITITVGAELNQTLREYAMLYREIYGEAESVSELVPFMLEAFLESDRGFAKARKEGWLDVESKATARKGVPDRGPGTCNIGGQTPSPRAPNAQKA